MKKYFTKNEETLEFEEVNNVVSKENKRKEFFIKFVFISIIFIIIAIIGDIKHSLRVKDLNNQLNSKQKQLDSLKQQLHITTQINKGLSELRRIKRLPNHIVSYYTPESSSNLTANGEYYNGKELTCASNIHPFGTKLKIINPKTMKSIIVRVNDRGGFTKYGRTLDLSKYAFCQIGSINKGLLKVKIEEV